MNHVFEATIEFTTAEGRVIRSTRQLLANLWEKPSVGDQLHIRYDPDNPDDWTWSNEDAERDAATGTGSARAAEMTFGGVAVLNASGADPTTVIEKLERLRDQNLISDQQLQAAKAQLQGAAPQDVTGGAPGSGTADRLRKLDQLRAEGMVTDGEYEEQRKRILDSI